MDLTLWRDVKGRLRRHDLPLYAAGVTFYAVVAAVPLLLVGVWLAGLLTGQASVRSEMQQAAAGLPVPVDEAVRWLAERGSRLPSLAALAALVPAGLYGEGLVRAFARLSPDVVRARALRGRLVTVVLVALSPGLVLLAALTATSLPDRPRWLSVYLLFVLTWIGASVLLALAYRLLTPASPGPYALAWSAAGAGSFVAGFGLGFLLFLELGIPIGPAYGGAQELAVTAIGVLWVQGLHLMALVGYALSLSLDARRP